VLGRHLVRCIYLHSQPSPFECGEGGTSGAASSPPVPCPPLPSPPSPLPIPPPLPSPPPLRPHLVQVDACIVSEVRVAASQGHQVGHHLTHGGTGEGRGGEGKGEECRGMWRACDGHGEWGVVCGGGMDQEG
jgi:hypothetical protein